MDTHESIFARDAERFIATDLARGPWDPANCHGGAPAALLAAAVDAAPSLGPMQGARLTFDLQRPVPVGLPLDLTVTIAREGRRIQTLEASLRDGNTELVHCRALRIRTTALDLPDERPRPGPAVTPGPDGLHRFVGRDDRGLEGFWRAVDVRFVASTLNEPGEGIAWIRVLARLADGLELTPLARAAAASDFGNGIGAPLKMGPHRYINPDVSLALHRLPAGEWISSRAYAVAEEHGVGLATAELGDEDGVIGRSMQTLYVDEAPRSG